MFFVFHYLFSIFPGFSYCLSFVVGYLLPTSVRLPLEPPPSNIIFEEPTTTTPSRTTKHEHARTCTSLELARP